MHDDDRQTVASEVEVIQVQVLYVLHHDVCDGARHPTIGIVIHIHHDV